ncbi:MAG: AraC family ligand binding domain-containing protein, partial [Opitutaceae bacterium]
MKVSRPLDVSLPAGGVLFAESVHAPDFAMPRRVDPFHKLVYVLRGRVSCARGRPEARVEVGDGGMIAIATGCPHRLSDLAASTLLLLCLDADWIAMEPEREQLWSELTSDPRAVAVLDRPARLRSEAIWRRAMAEQARPRVGSGLLARSLADQALV